VKKECVAGDVEGHAQDGVAASLVDLDRQLALSYVQLEGPVTRRKRHVLQVLRVPCRDDVPPRVRILLERLDGVLDLVDRLTLASEPSDPLNAVDRPQLTVLGGELRVVHDLLLVDRDLPFPLRRVGFGNILAGLLKVLLERPVAPDVVVLLEKALDVAVAVEEPEKLAQDQPERNLLCRDERKALRQVVVQTFAEQTQGSRAGAIRSIDAGVLDPPKKILVLRVYQ